MGKYLRDKGGDVIRRLLDGNLLPFELTEEIGCIQHQQPKIADWN
jgi:hypothetical protein